jgi:SulP family sulfate permease
MVSIIHAIGILLSMFLLAPIMQKIPLAALAGVLMVTAWRMNEWHAIRFIFNKRFKSDMLAFSATMLATITLDLTQAILIGSLIGGAIFLNKIASLQIDIQDVDSEKLKSRGINISQKCPHIRVAYLTGPIFFAASGIFNEAFSQLRDMQTLILSMRAVPLLDTSGLEVIQRLQDKIKQRGGQLMLAGVHENVRAMMQRSGLEDSIGVENFFWSSEQAILAADKLECSICKV